MLGCFLLARRLSGVYWGGLAALALAIVYPSFSVQTGRLFPDPVTGCFFVWSAWFYSESVHRQSRKWMFATGLALTMALFVRSQLFHYFLVLVPLALILSAPLWFRDPKSRGLAASFVLGCLPLVVVWLSIVRVVGDDLSEIEAFGNFTFQQRYPYGFWQFLDSDGWMGPYRLGKEPYYQALEVEAEASPELGTSYSRQLLFTARYVYSRAGESVVMVLDNVYRLYDRPANDYKWDYPFPYRYQVTFQKSILVFSLAGMGVLISTAPKYAGVFFVPFCLALLHGLSYPWPRLNQPAMPILIASAGVFLTWGVGKCVSLWKTRKSGLTPVAFAVMVAVFLFGGRRALPSEPSVCISPDWVVGPAGTGVDSISSGCPSFRARSSSTDPARGEHLVGPDDADRRSHFARSVMAPSPHRDRLRNAGCGAGDHPFGGGIGSIAKRQ